MTSEKPFLTIDEQIDKLKSRHLLFSSEENAASLLTQYGYYEIINGYKDSFMKDPYNDDAGFKDNVAFEDIYSLFNMDRRLREDVMNTLELFESNLRQVTAYTVAEQISDDQRIYIDRKKYRVGKKYYDKRENKCVYPIDVLLKQMTSITKSQTNPFKHYREHHGNIPPWILVKKLSFGNLIWWIKLMKSAQSDIIIARMLGLPYVSLVEKFPYFRDIFSSLLNLYLNYRNTAAHGGRIYNHYSEKHGLPYIELLHKEILKISPADYRNGKGTSHFGVLVRSLALFKNKTIFTELDQTSAYHIAQYLELHPEDRQYIFDVMELPNNFLPEK